MPQHKIASTTNARASGPRPLIQLKADEKIKLLALDKPALKFLYGYAKPYKIQILLAFIASIPAAVFAGLPAWAFKEVTDRFTQSAPLRELLFWLGLGLLFVVARSVLLIFNRVLLTTLHARLSNDIRNHLYARIQSGSMLFHTQIRTGEITSLVGNDAQSAASGVPEVFNAVWQAPATLICLFGVMIYFNWTFFALALLILPLLSYLMTRISKKARDAELKYMEHQSHLFGHMVESLTNVEQIKSFGLDAQQQSKIADEGENLVVFRRKLALVKSLVAPSTEVMIGLAITLMVLVAYYQLQNNTTTSGAIAGCLVAMLGTRKPLKTISRSLVELQRAFAAIRRILWVSGVRGPKTKTQTVAGPIRSLRLENVSFSYDERHHVLKDITLSATRGERLAIIGSSGAGKTTLCELILGFFPPSSGRIFIDDLDLASVSLASWRWQVGIVSQEPLLFDTSIGENIRYGNANATQQEILAAIDKSGCHEIVRRLPEGMDTRVGERGCRLSGGERKRVALARALVRPISVLILDEATSELDPTTEKTILDVIDNLAQEMIIIHVSHRPSILDHCDRAVTLMQGRLSETA